MGHVKGFLVGAAIYWVTNKASTMDFIQSASPTVGKFAPFAIAGGLTVLARHYIK